MMNLLSSVVAIGLACDHLRVATIVGFDQPPTHVIVRVETDISFIELEVYELSDAAKGSPEVIPIVSKADPMAERGSLRSKRWRAAEASLKKRGFVFMPKYAELTTTPDGTFELGGGMVIGVTKTVTYCEGMPEMRWTANCPVSMSTYALEIRAGKRTATFASSVCSFERMVGGPAPDCAEECVPRRAALSPDRKWLLVFAGKEMEVLQGIYSMAGLSHQVGR